MAKTMTMGLVALAFVAGFITTGTLAFAGDDDDDDDDGNFMQTLVCPAGNSQIITGYEVRPGRDIQHATEPTITDGGRFLVSTINHVDDVIDVTGSDVANRLNELGYFVDDGSVRDVNLGDVIVDIEGTNPFCMES